MIGVGAPQLGLLVGLAMVAPVLLGGSELVVVVPGVSAVLLVTVAGEPVAGVGAPTEELLAVS
jgi:hypothetical protein